ncbi:NUDIX hydrolase [Vibrio antiquarius]|uniref:NUDIX hydrolase n=1 Tax=Vibrio parahaemolyticus TaxID=670 RepID=A0A8H9TKN7_VIBPH|nr:MULTISPECIES: NUDIX hydrolase [Vibrio harveyi group]EGQ8962178.1 NUDIX domain-containing protein [Vibrio parahaemolyticus]EGR3229367.1 NUDIX hydrolase [Vibrio parahaemolyticus]EGR5928131.1 NUDIX hydrolase [Vibrio parahaemolyticus]KOE76747.1 hypothetical protein ACS91_27625 [Vibrio parahaemolyticus]KOF28313.1 hypothetical protein ACX13_16895 [Vibrio parahaemolyticus]
MIEKKKLSCGVIVVDSNNLVLMQHVTGQDHWDIPKGTQNPGETTKETAVRELEEETGLVVKEEDLIEIGWFFYNKFKDLYLYMLKVDSVNLKELKCRSTFIDELKYEVPEADFYEMVSIDQMKDRACRSMHTLLNFKLESEIKTLISRF